jgi:hypothetical protein
MCPHTGRWQQTVNKHCNPPTMPKGSGKIHQTVPHPISHGYGQKGGIKFGEVQIEGRGNCSNFNLLGKCPDPNCTYNHKPAKVGEERQVAVAKKIDQAMATMKGAGPA